MSERIRPMAEEYETSGLDNAACPWCGFVDEDSWEYPDSTDTECGECSKPMAVERHMSVTYSTKRIAAK